MKNFGEAAAAGQQFALRACRPACLTRDAVLIQRRSNELEVGSVIVGDIPSFRVDQMPYGGVKDSGFGREGLRYSIEDMTERKLMVMALK